ncbi:hypothetical protein ACFL2Z_03830 [Candidatus Eisenbacteria bacterium]|uniref:Uncharacterized protein n=1 Tax=Eiseniibacteriota bacterium TaxID=2212470 RepID=A0ABV6YPM5_UNCEI
MVDKRDGFDFLHTWQLASIQSDLSETQQKIESVQSGIDDIAAEQARARLRREYLKKLKNAVFTLEKEVDLLESLSDRTVQYMFLRIHHNVITKLVATAVSEFDTFEAKEYANDIKTRLASVVGAVEGEIRFSDRALCDEYVSRRRKNQVAISEDRDCIGDLKRRRKEKKSKNPWDCLGMLIFVLCVGVIGTGTIHLLMGMWKTFAYLTVPAITLAVVILVRIGKKSKVSNEEVANLGRQIQSRESDLESAIARDKKASEEFWAEFARIHPEYKKIAAALVVRPANES